MMRIPAKPAEDVKWFSLEKYYCQLKDLLKYKSGNPRSKQQTLWDWFQHTLPLYAKTKELPTGALVGHTKKFQKIDFLTHESQP